MCQIVCLLPGLAWARSSTRLGNFSAAHRVVETAMERVSLGSPHYQDICKKLHEVVDLGSK